MDEVASVIARYPYADGDRLETRNTYFYSPYEGRAFLDAWAAARHQAIAGVAAPSDAPVARTVAEPGELETRRWLERWRSGARLTGKERRRFELRLRHFEVSKRLYPAYDAAGKPVDRDDYRMPRRYLDFALMLEAGYAAERDLRCLNALLKCMDTLSGLALDSAEACALAWLARREQAHVATLAAEHGVAWDPA